MEKPWSLEDIRRLWGQGCGGRELTDEDRNPQKSASTKAYQERIKREQKEKEEAAAALAAKREQTKEAARNDWLIFARGGSPISPHGAQIAWRAGYPDQFLAPEAAKAFAKDIDWTATHTCMAASMLPPEAFDRLQKMKGHLESMEDLLAESLPLQIAISKLISPAELHISSDALGWILEQRKFLARVERAQAIANHYRHMASPKNPEPAPTDSEKYNIDDPSWWERRKSEIRPQRVFAYHLCRYVAKYSGDPAEFTRNKATGNKVCGPFPEIVWQAWELCFEGATPPDGETIRRVIEHLSS